ncbi:MAG: carboxypeptidase regulatory-like domain-containing protein [Ignavibacteria bacterium]|nr:carboxypeptidase regulatory-like domain-containing protein [Ignavibacteria bacterium]
MRKVIFLISFISLVSGCIFLSGWKSLSSGAGAIIPVSDGTDRVDTNAIKYFPLQTGNSWTYKVISSAGDTSFTKIIVLSDTVINGTAYCKLSSQLPFLPGNLVTIDSVTGNIYSYSENPECQFRNKGTLLDSLSAGNGDKTLRCSGSSFYGQCLDTLSEFIFGIKRETKMMLSPAMPQLKLMNRFAEKIGIIYASKLEGAISTFCNLTGCLINGELIGDTSTLVNISGKVVYSDNNLPAVNGYVKALRLNRTSGEIIVIDSAQINSDGIYSLFSIPTDNCYIVAYPNSEEVSDFVATYYPSTVDWQAAERVTVNTSSNNMKISVYRKSVQQNGYSISGKVYPAQNNFNGLKDANIYIKQGNIFRAFCKSDVNGLYSANHLLPGTYTMVVNRIGYFDFTQNITISGGNLENINFFLISTFVKEVNGYSNQPKNFKLAQNFPNPFNPETIIRFEVPKPAFVSLKVYNSLGKEISELVNEMKQQGIYEVDFSSKNLSSGVYFYTLSSEDYIETKRMVIIR